ncbi:MAG: pyridoxamine 5-phosphate oxidase-related, FMN-binding protein [Firmicutes bacterium]|nr:pyridoxamine 5-phosphate oxidase-related, FMN-binding protein [Bacillota bacterium]
MKAVVKFIQENITGCLATVENGKPKVRPFQFMFEENGKFVFCSNNTKDVSKQLKANPYVEFSSSSPNFAWIRLSGKVEFSNDLKLKEKVLETSGLVKSLYKTADNPIFEIFYIEHGTAILADFSGQPPKTINF